MEVDEEIVNQERGETEIRCIEIPDKDTDFKEMELNRDTERDHVRDRERHHEGQEEGPCKGQGEGRG